MNGNTMLAICNETWGELPFAATCERIAAAGYEGVEIAPFTLAREFGKPADTLTDSERQYLRETAEKAGLTISGLHWLLVPPPEGLHLTTEDKAVRAETARYLAGLANLCADLGGTYLVLGSPKQRGLVPGVTTDEATARFVETIHPCLEVATARGVVLCVEPLGPEETNFINTLAEARTIIERANHPACRAIFDVKAAGTEGIPFPELIATHADIIAHVHANDVNRRAPGMGETDFVPILAALDRAGYAGWISVEVFDYAPDPDTVARTGIATLQAASEGLHS